MSSVQTNIFGDAEHSDVVEIETNGRILRPLLELPRALVDELKLRVTDEGLQATAVDPANVAMVQFDTTTAAFDAFDLDTSAVLGVNIERLRKRAKRARMRKNDPDPITLDLDERRALVTTEREYADTTVRQTDELQLIDPDSIRQEPDVPELDLTYSATVDVRAFNDTVQSLNTSGDHIELAENDGALTLSVNGDSRALADFGHVADPVGEPNPGSSSMFTTDYLTDITSGLKKAKIDTVTLTWGDSLPMFFDFERTVEDGDEEQTAYTGRYMLAPRIGGDDE